MSNHTGFLFLSRKRLNAVDGNIACQLLAINKEPVVFTTEVSDFQSLLGI